MNTLQRNSESFYFPIRESPIFDSLVFYSLNKEPYVEYYSFGMKLIPREVLFQDPFLLSLFSIHPFDGAILLIPKLSIYNWHIDDRRGASVNMLISDTDSHCIFVEGGFKMVNNIQELSYKPRTYYFFNSQEHHSVINTKSDRYLFSIEFLEDKSSLSYRQLISEYQSGLFGT